jgi:hypothetical protein
MTPEVTDSDADARRGAADVPADADARETGPEGTGVRAEATDRAETTDRADPADEDAALDRSGPADVYTPAHSAPPADAAATPGTRDPAGAGDAGGPLVADAAELRTILQRLQAGFVDDPRGSVSEAAELVDHATQALVGALQQRQRQARELWDGDETPDTEGLRLALQRYRALFNQICPR